MPSELLSLLLDRTGAISEKIPFALSASCEWENIFKEALHELAMVLENKSRSVESVHDVCLWLQLSEVIVHKQHHIDSALERAQFFTVGLGNEAIEGALSLDFIKDDEFLANFLDSDASLSSPWTRILTVRDKTLDFIL